MDDSFDIEKLVYFKFNVDEDGYDGHYTLIRKQGAGNDWPKTLKKIRKAFDGSLPNTTHSPIGNPGAYKKLSIKIPGNRKKNLLIFGINSGARFKKDTRPIVFPNGNPNNAFGDSFILAPDSNFGTMKVIDPENDTIAFPDNSWAAVSFDEAILSSSEVHSFAFMIDYIKSAAAPPEDAWPGPPHNSAS